jgi:putative ABC transport system substrate-binding protein
MTGVKQHFVQYGPKQLELLKELAPALERVAWLAYPIDSENRKHARRVAYENLELSGRKLGVSIVPLEVSTPQEIGVAFDRAAAARARGMIVVPGSLFHQEAKTIADLARRHRIATAFGDSLWVRAGGLVSYGIDFADQFARTAPYVDRVLRGAKPAELPVDQAERFVTAINRRTADALGLKIPRSLLVRADEVIE